MPGWLSDLRRDVPYALRALRRSPEFTLLALLTLALGIGANAAIYSVVNAVLVRPLPYARPAELLRVYESLKDSPGWTGTASVANLKDWREQSRTVEHFVAYQTAGRNLEGGATPERLLGVAASANLFAALRVPPLRGRTFAPDEDQPGHNTVVVLSEGFWRRRFAADASIIGRPILLDGIPHTVLGVMPSTFAFPAGGFKADIWVPYTPRETDLQQRGNHFLNVVARLRPGVTQEQAATEMRAIALRLEAQYPDVQSNRTVLLMSLHESMVGRVKPALLVMLGAVGLVLLIACANVANLMLARAAARRREVAVRVALGATRGQLVRQCLTESLLLAIGAAALGALGARWGLSALATLTERALPVSGPVPLDLPVLGVLLVVSMACGIAFGLAPALATTADTLRNDLASVGTRLTASGAQQRYRNALVVTQIALSLVLLVGAGLLIRTFARLSATPSGLETHNVVAMQLSVPRGRYGLDSMANRLYRPILERVRAVPGVAAAGMTSMLPIENWGTNGGFWVEGQPKPAPGKAPVTELRQIAPGYLATMGIPLRAGRDFTDADGAGNGNPVLINESLARKFFPNENAVGRQLRRGPTETGLFTIVGVVGAVRQAGLDREPMPEMYFPYTMANVSFATLTLVVRTSLPVAGVIEPLRAAVRGVASDVPVYGVRTMEEVIGRSFAARRLNLWLLGIFAGVALALAASGLFGVISYLVAQRTREIGIRIALGADRGRVVRLVLGQGARLAAIGIAVGLVGAFALTRLLTSMLYGVGTRDPLTFASVPTLLAVVALIASYVPAWRASRVDPMVAIRSD